MHESQDSLEGIETLPYSGAPAALRLRGPSAQILKLNMAGPVAIQWAPVDRRALEVELRVLPLWSSAFALFDPGKIPIVFYQLRYGHGVYTWNEPREPPAPFSATGFVEFQPYVLPARGMLLRLSVRECQLTLRCDRTVDGTPVDRNDIAVSFQPVYSAQPPARKSVV